MPHATLPPDGMPPRVQCMRFIEERGRQCRAKAEPGDAWCRFHGGRAPSHEGKKQERIADYQEQLMELADTALDTIQAKLDSPNHAVALRAALEILDRAGVVTTKKTESTTTIQQKSEIDSKIEQLLAEMSGTASAGSDDSEGSPENGRLLPATSFSSSADGDPSSHHQPPRQGNDEFGVAGGGSGLGISGSGASGNDENIEDVE